MLQNSMDFDKYVMLCIYHYNVIWNSLTALKNSLCLTSTLILNPLSLCLVPLPWIPVLSLL